MKEIYIRGSVRICFKLLPTFSSNCLWWKPWGERKKIVSGNTRERESVNFHHMNARTGRAFWLMPAQGKKKGEKIICIASLLADPISGSTMNRGRRSKYAFYPLQVHAIRFMADMREPRYSCTHCFPMNF